MYNYIINPKNSEKIEILSIQGKNLLKSYIKNFIGGANRGRTNRPMKKKGKQRMHAIAKPQLLNRLRRRQRTKFQN